MKRILTEREEAVMHVLWRLKKAFVKEILAELPDQDIPYNTISSVVRKLEKEGLISYNAFGNTHQYFPILKKYQYKKQVMKRVMRDYFAGSPEALLSHFIKEENVDKDELLNLIEKLDEYK